MIELRSTQLDYIREKFNVQDPTNGLTLAEVSDRRGSYGNDGNEIFGTVPPPIQCPSWVCCLLPCIKDLPSMKIYRQIYPEEAIVLRSSNWIVYDSTSLVVGDIIQLKEGDLVPADCIVLSNNTNHNSKNKLTPDSEVLVDLKYVTGHTKPQKVYPFEPENNELANSSNIQQQKRNHTLFWGGQIVQGGTVIAICTAVGIRTKVGQLIQNGQFPPPLIKSSSNLIANHDTNNSEDDDYDCSNTDNNATVSLL